MKRLLPILAVAVACLSMRLPAAEPRVAPGVEVLLARHMDWIAGKRVGLITNQTGVARDLRSSIDLLAARPECKLTALFCAEHGIRGVVGAGKKVGDERDEKTGLPVRSLYGETRRPTPQMLADVDVLLYDIQDIGVRGYTYIATLGYAMEAAFAAGKGFIVLDRPDPMGGLMLDGPVIPNALVSFVSAYELPWVYGMTPGETARWICQTKGLTGDLKVAPLAGWKRGMSYEETGLAWIPPSPCVTRADTALYYAVTGAIGELQVVSEGAGTALPFELVGAPWIDAEAFTEDLRKRRLPGVLFSPAHFTPRDYGFKDKTCEGAQIHIMDRAAYSPSAVMIALVQSLARLYPSRPLFDAAPFEKAPEPVRMFDCVLGCSWFRQRLSGGAKAEDILAAWKAERDRFAPTRQAALIYPAEGK
ncbi:MAG: DUF1343 domain-containing protein [Candidatus Sumerlaeota bacterium]|nr:DUF1343 domain-containing protein [Candidatus Sumerlaeota bacterium]